MVLSVNMKLLFVLGVLVARGCGDNNAHVTDFVSKLLEGSAQNIVYLVLDCQPPGLRNVIALVKDLGQRLARARINVMTVPVSRNVSHPLIFTADQGQLLEALQSYACVSTVTDSRPSKATGLPSVISSTADQMYHNDVMLVMPAAEERDHVWSSSSLAPQLRDKQISVNVVMSGNSRNADQYASLARTTGGRILTYNTPPGREETPETQTKIESRGPPVYSIKTVRKEQLMQDTRTAFALPERTAQIFMTLNGSIRKALLISQSGVIINIASPVGQHRSEYSRSDSLSLESAIIGFKLPIAKSPADWILSASGDKYNVTMIIITKETVNNREQQSSRAGDFVAANAFQPLNFQPNSNFTDANRGEEISERRQDHGAPVVFVESNPRVNLRADLFVDPVKNALPTAIDVDPLSTFYAFPGEEAQIVFNVRNNKLIPVMYFFDCFYAQQPCFVRPTQVDLGPQQRVQVYITIRAEGSEGSSNVVALISESIETTVKKVYLNIGKQRSDSRKPDIDYEYNGNCDEANTGGTCHRRRWSANIVAKDYESGLLNFWSEPSGLMYTSEFICGMRDVVTARYSASCCDPKVDILASDLRGNTYRVTLNVEHQYLSPIEIITIVLGVILLVVIVTVLIYGIIKWRRKKNERSFLMNSHTVQDGSANTPTRRHAHVRSDDNLHFEPSYHNRQYIAFSPV